MFEVKGRQKEMLIRSEKELQKIQWQHDRNPKWRRRTSFPFVKSKHARVEPELKKFLDECVIPILVREALKELFLESPPRGAPHSNCGNDSARPGVR